MNREDQTLFILIDYALHQRGQIPDGDYGDWETIVLEAKNQTVIALAAEALPDSVSPHIQEKWKKSEYLHAASYMRYMYAQDELCELFQAHSIPMAILKGSSASLYYPKPELRAMGDIDVIVPPEVFDRAKALLEKNDYALESDDGRHYSCTKDGIEVELHRRFNYDEKDKKVNDIVKESFPGIIRKRIDDHVFPMLPELANGIVLLSHMCEHLRSGMGLRQLIDWMMYVERVLSDEFWENQFKAAAVKLGMDTVAITAARACQKYLGLPETITWCRDADEDLCDVLMNNIMASGNFGRKNGTGSHFESVATAIIRKGFFGNLQAAGERNWAILRKHPGLKPFAWLFQIIRYCLQVFSARRGKETIGDLRRARERYDMLRKLGID